MTSTSPALRLLIGTLLGTLMAFSVVVLPAAAAPDSQLVLVLDSSGSMKEKVGGRSKISIAKAALRTVVGRLPADAPVGLRVYGATVFDKRDRGACTDSQLVVPIGTDNRAELRREIATYQPYGETPISYSLIQAARDLGDDGKRSILLVSDGEETCNADPCATAAAIAKKNIQVKIDVVGLAVSGRVRSQLQCVAGRGRGTYYDADSTADLEDSLDKLATRAFRPFTLSGTPIRGTTKKRAAPVAPPGQYLDHMPGGDASLFYRLPRSIPGSTLHVGVTTLAARGDVLAVMPRILRSGGGLCGSGYGGGIAIVGSRPVVSAEADSWVTTSDSGCFTDDELLLELLNSPDLQGKKFELVVTEEPPVASMRDLPPTAAETVWRSMKGVPKAGRAPVAGTSLSDAAVLSPGSYTTKILTGENQVFAVRTDWGQRVQVQASIAPRHGALARAMDVSNSLDLRLIGPLRGTYTNLRVRSMPRSDTNMQDDAATYRVYGTTPEVRYLNRSGSFIFPASVPGLQYVVLNLSNDYVQGRYLVPYRLTVKVVGTAGRGRPEYVGAPTPTPTPEPTPTVTSSTPVAVPTAVPTPGPAAEPSGGVPVGAVVAIGLGTAALGAGAVAVTSIVRRRRARDVSP